MLFINAHPMTLRIVEELVTLGDKMTWATSTQKESLADAKVAFNASDKLVHEAGGILGTMLLANALLTNTAVEASKTYVASKLKISMASLPSSLRDRLALHSRQGKKSASSDAGGAAKSLASASTTVLSLVGGSAADEAGAAGDKKVKRMRLISSSA